MMFCFSRSIRMMKAHLKILILYRALSGVLVKSGNVFEGTVGEKVVIRCPFLDLHIYTPQYFCRDPCSSSKDVLIKTEKIDEVVSAGRYSVMSTTNSKTLTVTIKHLTLKDSGVYYCGLDQWFRDTLKKVQLVVRPAPVTLALNTPAAVLNSTHTLNHTVASTTTHTYTDNSSLPSPVQFIKSSTVDVSLVYCVLLLLLLCALVALVLLYKRKSVSKSSALNHPTPDNADTPDPNQNIEDVYHLYDGLVTEHCSVGQPKADDLSLIYSTVQNCDLAPQDNVNALYSLITLQQM